MGCVESTASDEPAMDANGMFPPLESWRKWAKLSLSEETSCSDSNYTDFIGFPLQTTSSTAEAAAAAAAAAIRL